MKIFIFLSIFLIIGSTLAMPDNFWRDEVDWNLMMAEYVMNPIHYTIESGYYEDMGMDERIYFRHQFLEGAKYSVDCMENPKTVKEYGVHCIAIGQAVA